MAKKNKHVSDAHIEITTPKGGTIIIPNFFPTIHALNDFGKVFAKGKDRFWKGAGEDMIEDSYFFHYLVCKEKMPKSIALDVKDYAKWKREQKKIRRRKK